MTGKILFIHGFGSCGSGEKPATLRAYFGTENLLAPDLQTDPAVAVENLGRILADRRVDLLVGSSLGGFFALWLNRQRPLPTVLINPALQPWDILAPWIGVNRNWCTGEPFELTRAHLDTLRTMRRDPNPAREQYLVLLGRRDELLDHRDAARRFADFHVRVDRWGDHRFTRLAHYLDAIFDFRDSARCARQSII